MKKKFFSLSLTLLLGLFSWNAIAQISISGATGITDGTTYTTLKGAFDAINTNASGVNTDNIAIKISDNTTETATAVLNPSMGVSTISTSAGSGYQAPVVTLNGGTKTVVGTLVTTITNGKITSIAMTGGTWTAAPTITIAAPAGGGTTATATASLSASQVVFTMTNGGTNYGPSATFSVGDGTGAAVDVKMTTAATAPAATPATVGLTYVLTCPGSGYTSAPTCDISTVAGGTGGTVTVATLYPSIEFSKLAIYPTVAGKTISGAVGLISIVGRKNVTIDGRVNRTGTPTVGSADNLTISCTHAGNAAITLNSNAQNDTIQYCTIKGQEVTSPLGILNFGTAASLANGNGLNVIDHNLFKPSSGTVPSYAICAQGNSAFPNVGNKITNNNFEDLIAQYVASTTLYMTGGITSPTNDNYTISGNSFYNTVAMTDYAATNLTKIIIGIGASTSAFGGSHTITDNYIGGTAANCGGSVFTKTARETTFYGMNIYLSPSVSGGSATSIQNNTIQKISWANDYYPANWLGITIGGTGAVNIGNETGNTIGDNTTNGSITVSNKSNLSASATMINIGTTGAVNCQSNKIGSITASHATANYVTSINCIVKTGVAGATTISNNVIGSTTQANSINATCTGTTTQTIYGINCTGTGINTVSNNTIANMTNNVSAVGNIYSISCTGTNSNTVSNNTIANITNTTTTGGTYGINLGGAGSTGTANGNLVHSIGVGSTATTATVFGIWGALGTNTITNNIVKIGDNNACEIRGIGDPSATTSNSAYHNTVYLTGAPTTLALNSSCIYSSGSATIRNYKNNLLVNARSNNGATGTHYALNMTANATGTIAVDGNDYVASGTGGVLGSYSGNKTTLPIVTGNDGNSVTVSPSFVNAGGTTASDYKLTSSTSMTGVLGTSVGLDYDGATRVGTIIGAFEMATLTTSVSALSDLNYAPTGPSNYLNSFNVSGSAISGHITVTAPTNFEVSKTGVTSEFSPSVTVTATNGSVAATPIYVRLVANLSATTYTGDVTVSAAGATSKTVTCSGLVDATVGAKSPLADGLRIVTTNGLVNITGAKAGQLIEVYNVSGSCISSAIATDGDNRLTLSAKGFQLIKIGTEVRKIMVK
ncbi:MAG: beta strand repeat-containing protein [Bacteroidales bacterium]